jgi:hypothetical protein
MNPEESKQIVFVGWLETTNIAVIKPLADDT